VGEEIKRFKKCGLWEILDSVTNAGYGLWVTIAGMAPGMYGLFKEYDLVGSAGQESWS
jgi:hypothetical protein